jgi:hypothetical protein
MPGDTISKNKRRLLNLLKKQHPRTSTLYQLQVGMTVKAGLAASQTTKPALQNTFYGVFNG